MHDVPSINSGDFSVLLDSGKLNILDVREPEEIALSGIGGSTNIPMMELESNLEYLHREFASSDEPIIVVCKSGARSAMVTAYLLERGFINIHNLSGGINELAKIRSEIVAY
jgi:rhodanese-related sulfurtransferase